MRCKPEKPSLRGLLAGHFAPSPLEDLVVTRADFPHWMRPDLQRAIETLVAELPKHRFAGLRLRGRETEIRFADLAEAGSKSVAIGPASYQDIDIGEADPVRCATRALWLAEREDVPFALLLDVEEGYHHVRVRVEIAARPDAESRRVTARIGEQLRAGAAEARCWRGKTLMLDPARQQILARNPYGQSRFFGWPSRNSASIGSVTTARQYVAQDNAPHHRDLATFWVVEFSRRVHK